MPELIIHKTVKDFINYNEAYFAEQYLQCFNMIKMLEKRSENKMTITNAFNVVADNSFVICIIFNRVHFMIFGHCSEEEVVAKISEFAKLDMAPSGLSFMGHRSLIMSLMTSNKKDYNIFKDRLIYECSGVNHINPSEGTFAVATLDDMEVVAQMSYAYQLEEYKENSQRSAEYMKDLVAKGIMAQNFYTWKHYDKVSWIQRLL